MTLVIRGGIEFKTGPLYDDLLSISLPDNNKKVGVMGIPIRELLAATFYVLTNTDLTGPDDARLEFLKIMSLMKEVEGYRSGKTRLVYVKPEISWSLMYPATLKGDR